MEDDQTNRAVRAPPSAPALARGQRLIVAAAIVLVALIVHVWFVDGIVRSSDTLGHDDTISQLAASGHLDEWQQLAVGGSPAGLHQLGFRAGALVGHIELANVYRLVPTG